MRETCEEIGTIPAGVQILEALAPVEARTTGYRVWPFAASLGVDADQHWVPQPGEATAVLEVSVPRLAAESAVGSGQFSFPGWDEPRSMPTRTVDGHVVWGLTLRLIEPYLYDALHGRWPV